MNLAQLAYQAIHFLGDDALRTQGRAMGLELGGAADAVFGTLGWQGGDRRVLAQSLYEVMTVDLRRRLVRAAARRAPVGAPPQRLRPTETPGDLRPDRGRRTYGHD